MSTPAVHESCPYVIYWKLKVHSCHGLVFRLLRGSCLLSHKSSLKHVCQYWHLMVPLSRSCLQDNNWNHTLPPSAKKIWTDNRVSQPCISCKQPDWVEAVEGSLKILFEVHSTDKVSKSQRPWNQGVDNCLHLTPSLSLHLAKQGGKGHRGCKTEEKYIRECMQEIPSLDMVRGYYQCQLSQHEVRWKAFCGCFWFALCMSKRGRIIRHCSACLKHANCCLLVS